ncbi:diaminopimelate epimerase [Jonesia quinghaiensis]|uniref:diaminopimelate epimerase n=1 Tax=Jonesia quinghaiensis TaxID=262806 RepID=UPI0004150A06|nr:diaminopimelate epimerase [Jonesia quinghaiensis]
MTVLAFTKGHGTRNDFVLLDDRDNKLTLTADDVVALTDRRAGIGADGVIRLVAAQDSAEVAELVTQDPQVTWFMDYRNADGSIAAMCGNGVRVFAAFLEDLGLVEFTDHTPYPIATRAGIRTITKHGDWYQVGMGPGRLIFPEAEHNALRDSTVSLGGLSVSDVEHQEVAARPALSISMGNPHTVVALPTLDDLEALDLTVTPIVDPTPPHGTNVEFVVPLGVGLDDQGNHTGTLAMRVHERGVGETQSCGTGACAAAVAVHRWGGTDAPTTWNVNVPGGRVRVTITPEEVFLAGPAVLIGHGTVDTDQLGR